MKDLSNLGLGTWCVGAFMLSATFGILAGLALIPVHIWYERRRLREKAIRDALCFKYAMQARRNGES